MIYESKCWEDVEVGEELPGYHKDVTATTVIAGALASRDFQPIHHDKEFAKAHGAPDIFTDIITSGGWVGSFLSRWSGPLGEIKKVQISLGVPTFPGYPVDWSGKVINKYVKNGEHFVDVEYKASVQMGFAVKGIGTLLLPTKVRPKTKRSTQKPRLVKKSVWQVTH